ncbi:precorrin-6Y C5,15-methyltransferase subunit CbiT [Euhalothece natronophila Z-M001]|uniref:tRNA (guanine(46)-N(7))-methyltransferase n=1 Tax=Euhalothece natronophila Z-M001 TaxID=522448 RepID=A0A5B8NIH4_9CHRO|nr:precorrin-6Y C5,15-methyltransferase subunit CbiT [Euhalothece natronophila]QDZ38754.1 precorrin-6Y C5,15-methyltransferase subunit CbiT [Euhalothece natronophila Z-M001]
MASSIWPYKSPGIPDHLFERLPGIPLTKREVRILLLSYLRLEPDSVLWDVGAGTGTIPVESGLLCPDARIFAVERDEEVVDLIRHNCTRFGVKNVQVIQGVAPDCLSKLPKSPHRVCLEGGKDVHKNLEQVWQYIQPQGRVVAVANNLDSLYRLSETLAKLQARNIEVVQSSVNRLETRGPTQVFAAVDPIFILSGEKF